MKNNILSAKVAAQRFAGPVGPIALWIGKKEDIIVPLWQNTANKQILLALFEQYAEFEDDDGQMLLRPAEIGDVFVANFNFYEVCFNSEGFYIKKVTFLTKQNQAIRLGVMHDVPQEARLSAGLACTFGKEYPVWMFGHEDVSNPIYFPICFEDTRSFEHMEDEEVDANTEIRTLYLYEEVMTASFVGIIAKVEGRLEFKIDLTESFIDKALPKKQS